MLITLEAVTGAFTLGSTVMDGVWIGFGAGAGNVPLAGKPPNVFNKCSIWVDAVCETPGT